MISDSEPDAVTYKGKFFFSTRYAAPQPLKAETGASGVLRSDFGTQKK